MPTQPDSPSGEVSLQAVWRPLARRVAAAAGCLAALISLVNHVPASVASLRGAATWLAVTVVSKAGLAAVEASLRADRRAETREGESER